MMIFNLAPFTPMLTWLGMALFGLLSWALVMAYIRYEVRMSILDYANRLKAKQFGPTKTPYDAWCDDLHKELGRE